MPALTTQVPPAPTLQADSVYGELGLTGLEIACGVPLGRAEAIPLPRVEGDPRRVLEEVVLEALLRPPCVLGFSGGRDSSTLLAVATRVAAREGLDPPVPVTQTFPDLPETDEREWQELVARHLGIGDWLRIEQRDELDILGPIARPVLERFGPTYPSNSHFVVPLLERANGGTLMTGIDGDTLFGGWRWQRLADVARGVARPRTHDLITAAHRLSPMAVQRWRLRRAEAARPVQWLAPGARDRWREEIVRVLRVQPRSFGRYVSRLAGARYLALSRRQLDLYAADAGARVVHPFADPRFLAAVARWGGTHGRGSRTSIMVAVFSDVLPEPILTRGTKARFDRAYFGPHARAFAEEWDGSGVDPDLIDIEGLRAELASEAPASGVHSLLQWLWLNR
jgi:hypothetical protein